MIVYFPSIYPDELIYSWFCRYYVHSGCLNHKMVLRDLYCINSDSSNDDLIGDLRPEVIEQFDRMYSIEKLILSHTMCPQYARFLPLEQKKEAFALLSNLSGDKYFRFCPLCVEEDREIYGETYWHRKHQIRTIEICIRHKCRLMESKVPMTSEQTYMFYPAESHVFETETEPVSNELIQYATYLETVFDAPMDFEGDIAIHSLLYERISQRELLKPAERKQCIKKFADDLREFYENMELSAIASKGQIQKVLQGERCDFSVVCQIAFFLGMAPEELTVFLR